MNATYSHHPTVSVRYHGDATTIRFTPNRRALPNPPPPRRKPGLAYALAIIETEADAMHKAGHEIRALALLKIVDGLTAIMEDGRCE